MAKNNTKKISIKNKNDSKNRDTKTMPAVWNPWDIMDTFDRWFWEDPWAPFWNRPRWGGLMPRNKKLDQLFETDTRITAIDMQDTGKSYKILAEMPGVDKKDVEVNVTENYIKICGETKTERKEGQEGWIRRERSYSTICRQMSFPEEVDPNKADAKLENGILEITVNKKKPTTDKGKNIPVK